MVKVKRICQYCNNEFETTDFRVADGRGKFCSKKCFDNYRRGKIKSDRTGIYTSCETCGKKFYVTLSRVSEKRGKFCSQKCYYESKKGKPSPKWSRVKVICKMCGKDFFVNKARSNEAKYCSNKCYAKSIKGIPLSEDTKKKISEANKGKPHKPHNPEVIEKIRQKKIGVPSWNKGKSWSDEHKKKLSKVHLKGASGLTLMQNMANSKGGKCLSKEYTNTHTKLQFLCSEGHKFENQPAHILKGQWCPICSAGVSERLCREYFEHIFGFKFPKVRPKWLIGVKGYRLELDGYCKELNLAFEYQGRQHYSKNEFFHKKRSFDEQKKNDEIKKEICKARGITLIEIPDIKEKDRMDSLVIQECMKKGVDIPSAEFNPNEFDVSSPKRLREIQDIAISKGGVCLSIKYINTSTRLKFRCKTGHEWETSSTSIKSGSWCPYCAGLAKGTIEEMQRIATSRGGKCLSSEYINSQTKLYWECKEGHKWSATPSNIKRGKWCPKCSTKRAWEKRKASMKQ